MCLHPRLTSACAQGLREHGESVVLMGKNTMMKRSIRLFCERTGNEEWPGLVESLVGNVGLIFTKGDLNDVSWLFAVSLRCDFYVHLRLLV